MTNYLPTDLEAMGVTVTYQPEPTDREIVASYAGKIWVDEKKKILNSHSSAIFVICFFILALI